MSWTYRHRKALVTGAIAVSIALLVTAALYLLMQHTDQQRSQQQMKEEYERQIQQLKNENKQNSRDVWTTSKTIPAAAALTADDLKAVSMPVSIVPPGVITDRESIIGKRAKIELETGTPLLSSLLYEGQPVSEDLRLQEFQVIQLPSNLKPSQYIDVRIGFPTGEDFVLLSKKQVKELSGNVVWLELSEMDILRTSSAIIDAYLQGARLYVLPYVEPGLQDAAVVNYPANQKVLDLMKVDPNLLETAQTELARNLRQTLDGNLKAVSESDKLRVTSGNVTVQQQLQNERTTTRLGNSMNEMQPANTPQSGQPTVPTNEQQPALGDSSGTASSPATANQQPSPPTGSTSIPSVTLPAAETPQQTEISGRISSINEECAMKKIVSIGVADKTHAFLVLGRLLSALGNKVLLVDSTTAQPIRGYLPHTYANSAVQDYEGMDVAYGYLAPEQLERGLAQAGMTPTYDTMQVDTDHTESVSSHNLSHFDKRVWCWDGKRASLEKNEELMLRLGLQDAESSIKFFEMLAPAIPGHLVDWRAETRLRHIHWEETVFRFPLDERGAAADLSNQHHGRIDLRGITGVFRETQLTMLQQLGDCDREAARRAGPFARKRVRIW